jgi:large subunit ribosomal protein L25
VTGRVLHLDFYRVTADEKIRTNVAVEITGTATGVRKGGILEHIERELEIECFPGDLREKIVLDVTNLEIGESIHVKDIKGVGEILFLADPERVIVAVLSPSKVKEEAAVEPVEAAGTEGEKGAGSES